MIDKRDEEFNHILSNIEVQRNIDIREVYENAMKFNNKGTPLSINKNVAFRYIVNDIRHNYTNYDDNLKKIYRIDNGCQYKLYKNTVLKEISKVYPSFKEECEYQKILIPMVEIV